VRPTKFLFDTDWIADFLGNRTPAVDLLQSLLPDGIAISAITLMEIVEGVRGSRDPQAAEQGLRRFLQGVPVLDVTESIAARTGDIRLQLRRQNRQVHERALDIIIAATAIEHGLTLVVRNLAHFDDIPGLALHQPTQ
jgi:predicted nucleic acid-binding protein